MERASKVIVEVVDASNLLPKDEHGTSSPYVMVDFYGQRKKTPTAIRDLNPTWNATLAFDVGNGKHSDDIFGHILELNVFHDKNHGPTRRNSFLGRVRLSSTQFVRKGEEALMYYPLEKKGLFNWVQGEIGFKVYLVDDEEIPHLPPALSAEEMKPDAPPESESKPPVEAAPPPESSSEKVEESPASLQQPYQPPPAELPRGGDRPGEEPPAAEKSEGPATENATSDSEKPPEPEPEPEPPQRPTEGNFGLSGTI